MDPKIKALNTFTAKVIRLERDIEAAQDAVRAGGRGPMRAVRQGGPNDPS